MPARLGLQKPAGLTVSGGLGFDSLPGFGFRRDQNKEGDGATQPAGVYVGPAATNLCTNGGFETNTTGWTTGGTNTFAVDTGQAKFGAKSGKATYADNATLADYGATITNVAHTASVWVYIPTAYNGGGIELRQLNYTVAASAANAAMGTRDAWQQVILTFTPGADVTGNIQINNTGAAPTVGRFIYVDGFQIETGSIATPYIETDGGTAARAAGLLALPSWASYFSATQGWAFFRLKMGIASTTAITNSSGLMMIDDGTTNNTLWAYLRNSVGTGIDQIATRRVGAATGAVNLTSSLGAYAVGDGKSFAYKWTSALIGHSLDGGAFTTQAQTTIPTGMATSAKIAGGGGDAGSTGQVNSNILWSAFGSGTLTDADAAALHAQGSTPPADLNAVKRLVAAAATPTAYWNGKDNLFQIAATRTVA